MAVAGGDSWLDYVTAAGTLLASLGALAAVAITLYLNVWRERRRKPKLSLQLGSASEEGIVYPLEGIGAEVLPVPCKVRNGSGKNSAHGVEILLSAGYWLGPAEGEEGDKKFFEILNQEPISWWISDPPQGEGHPRAEIPAGVARKALLLILGHPANVFETVSRGELHLSPENLESLKRECFGAFAVFPLLPDTIHWIEEKSAYEIRLTVVAEDIDAVSYRTRLTWKASFEHLKSQTGYFAVRPVWDEVRQIAEKDWPGTPPED